MVLRVVLVLVALTLIARWLFPRLQVPWSVPIVLGLTVVGVRGVDWWLGQQ